MHPELYECSVCEYIYEAWSEEYPTYCSKCENENSFESLKEVELHDEGRMK